RVLAAALQVDRRRREIAEREALDRDRDAVGDARLHDESAPGRTGAAGLDDDAEVRIVAGIDAVDRGPGLRVTVDRRRRVDVELARLGDDPGAGAAVADVEFDRTTVVVDDACDRVAQRAGAAVVDAMLGDRLGLMRIDVRLVGTSIDDTAND